MPDAPDDPTESEIAGAADKLETMLRGSHPSVNIFFCGRRQLAFAWSPHFEAYLRTRGESNRHRQSVALPTTPQGRLSIGEYLLPAGQSWCAVRRCGCRRN